MQDTVTRLISVDWMLNYQCMQVELSLWHCTCVHTMNRLAVEEILVIMQYQQIISTYANPGVADCRSHTDEFFF